MMRLMNRRFYCGHERTYNVSNFLFWYLSRIKLLLILNDLAFTIVVNVVIVNEVGTELDTVG